MIPFVTRRENELPRHRRWREVVARQRLVRLYDLEPIA